MPTTFRPPGATPEQLMSGLLGLGPIGGLGEADMLSPARMALEKIQSLVGRYPVANPEALETALGAMSPEEHSAWVSVPGNRELLHGLYLRQYVKTLTNLLEPLRGLDPEEISAREFAPRPEHNLTTTAGSLFENLGQQLRTSVKGAEDYLSELMD